MLQRYFDQVTPLAMVDQEVYRAFLEVMHLVSPPRRLFQPHVVLGVVRQFLGSPRKGTEPAVQPGMAG